MYVGIASNFGYDILSDVTLLRPMYISCTSTGGTVEKR
jgi:hypothetical protein